ncbi:hypothetical protein BJ138DRAFT_976178, partial [Hygrophoropsis aurantiaca]
DDGSAEEMCVRIQGILCDKDLPPLASRPKNHQLQHVRQTVHITGLGDKTFASAVDSIFRGQSVLSRNITDDSLEEWKPIDFQGHLAIAISNRYFVNKRYANGAPKVPFSKLADSNGYLEDCSSAEYIHTEDNEVDYYLMSDGKPFFVNPSSFRIGDIVEACLSLVLHPVAAKKYKMFPVLRSLAIID